MPHSLISQSPVQLPRPDTSLNYSLAPVSGGTQKIEQTFGRRPYGSSEDTPWGQGSAHPSVVNSASGKVLTVYICVASWVRGGGDN